MKITIKGMDKKSNDAEMSIEYLGKELWQFTIGKAEFASTEVEKSMAFLKEDFNKSNEVINDNPLHLVNMAEKK